MFDIYSRLKQLQDKNVPTALVTVIATKGSTPRDTGSKMIVCGDGKVFGTIGGSAVEAMVIEEARECLKTNMAKKVWHDLDDHEKADTGMICGGKMEFFIEPMMKSPHLIIFGGGHVALPLARFTSTVGFELYDCRRSPGICIDGTIHGCKRDYTGSNRRTGPES